MERSEGGIVAGSNNLHSTQESLHLVEMAVGSYCRREPREAKHNLSVLGGFSEGTPGGVWSFVGKILC